MNHRLIFCVALTLGSIVSTPVDARTLVVDTAASHVTFHVSATGHSFVGHASNWTLAVTLPDGSTIPDSATFSVPVASLVTGDTDRDGEMHHWFQSDQFGTIDFKLVEFTGAPDALVARGELTMHGVTRKIEMPVSITVTNDTLSIKGTTTIDHRDFGLPKIRKLLLLAVNPAVKVSFDVTGKIE